MAEDSPELIKSLEENRRTLQKHIGCLAGLLQIFDRNRCLTGRRFGSQRTNTTTTYEDAASTGCGTDVTFHDPGSPLPTYHKYAGGSKLDSNQNSRGYEERVLSINKKELIQSRLSSDFVPLKSPPRTAPAAHCRASLDSTTRPSFDNFCRSPDSALIRNIVVNSLHKENPRSSVDNSNREVMAGLIRLKNLARSRSVGGRNGYNCSDHSKFPRSSSLSAHQSSTIYGEAPNLRTHRLTVDLEEGPGVGTKKLQRMSSSNEARQAVMNLDKALGEVDLKESFRALQREKSTRRSDLECVGERSPQDGRRNVVARLMGLEEFSPPPKLPRKDHCMRGRSVSPKHRLMDGMPSPLRRGKLMKLQEGGGKTLEPFRGERLQQLLSRSAAEERDTLNQIMETLQLKGLLHSPQRKSRSSTPEHVRQRPKDIHVASEQACHEMKHEETGSVKAPIIQRDHHHVECKSSRCECSERSDATTGTRCSNEDGGSAKPGRGRSRSPVRPSKSPVRSASKSPARSASKSPVRSASKSPASSASKSPVSSASKSPVRSASKSPVRASKSPVRLNNDARLTSQVSGTTLPSTKPVHSYSSHLKLQVVPGQVTNTPHLRDKRESKVALVTGKGSIHSHDPVSNGAIRNCDLAQTSSKSSPEMRRQKRTTSREMQSGASRSLSLGQEHEGKSFESVVDTEKPSEEEHLIQTSTNQDSCVDSNTSPAKIREMLETLNELQMPLKDAKESREIMTPRAGFQVEKISPVLEKSGQCSEGSCEQRSPVSVLDNSIFDEDGSPSPIPTDSYESNDQCDEVTRPENNATTSEETESDHTSSCDNAREFVEEFLKRSGITDHVNLASRVQHSEINPTLLTDLKEELQSVPFLEQGAHLSTLHPQALTDYVHELLALKVAECESTPWKRHNLGYAIWKELQDVPSAATGDICNAVQGILREDVGSRGPKWTDFGVEIGEVGVEVERMIYRDLMEEVVHDLTCSGSSKYLAKLLEGPRRQLFAS